MPSVAPTFTEMSSTVGSLIFWDEGMAAPYLVGQTEALWLGLIGALMLATLVHLKVVIFLTP